MRVHVGVIIIITHTPSSQSLTSALRCSISALSDFTLFSYTSESSLLSSISVESSSPLRSLRCSTVEPLGSGWISRRWLGPCQVIFIGLANEPLSWI